MSHLTALRFIDEQIGWAGGFADRDVPQIACQQAAPSAAQPCKGVVLRTADGGVTWQPVTVTVSNSLLQGTPQIRAIAVDPQQPATIYFVGNNNGTGFFRSSDAGNSWAGITLTGT